MEVDKLTYVLLELHFDQLNVYAGLKDQLASVVRENMDAFAGSPHDLGNTDLVVHRILTGDAPPFRHQLRTVPFARRQYLEAKVKRLLEVGAISSANLGACPYAS